VLVYEGTDVPLSRQIGQLSRRSCGSRDGRQTWWPANMFAKLRVSHGYSVPVSILIADQGPGGGVG